MSLSLLIVYTDGIIWELFPNTNHPLPPRNFGNTISLGIFQLFQEITNSQILFGNRFSVRPPTPLDYNGPLSSTAGIYWTNNYKSSYCFTGDGIGPGHTPTIATTKV